MTVQRLNDRFAKLKAENRAAFIAYTMANDPTPDQAFEILKGLAKTADIVELGLPFSDPMAEGPTIQLAAQRSLANGTKLAEVLSIVSRFRTLDKDTPIVLMGYLNPVFSYGYDRFAADAAKAGVDGLIIVDCPPEEAGPLVAALDQHDIALIRLATPTSDDHRLKTIVKNTSGFVYYVSVAGVTGVKEADVQSVAPNVDRVRAASGLPVAVGFGVKTPTRAAEIARIADATVVGSALVEEIAQALAQNTDPVAKVLERAFSLSDAVKNARLSAEV